MIIDFSTGTVVWFNLFGRVRLQYSRVGRIDDRLIHSTRND